MLDTPSTLFKPRAEAAMKSRLGMILAAMLVSSASLAYSQGVGSDVDKAAKDTADVTKTAAHKTAKGTEKAADKTADATKDAAKDTGHATKKAARKTKDRKSTRLNSSHRCISYAVFCL